MEKTTQQKPATQPTNDDARDEACKRLDKAIEEARRARDTNDAARDMLDDVLKDLVEARKALCDDEPGDE